MLKNLGEDPQAAWVLLNECARRLEWRLKLDENVRVKIESALK